MKKYILVILSLFVLPQIAYAVLPPTAESMRRIKTVLDSKEVYDTLGSANWIRSIVEENEDYIIRTDKCNLKVTIESTPLSEKNPGMVGPPLLKVKIGTLECVKNKD